MCSTGAKCSFLPCFAGEKKFGTKCRGQLNMQNTFSSKILTLVELQQSSNLSHQTSKCDNASLKYELQAKILNMCFLLLWDKCWNVTHYWGKWPVSVFFPPTGAVSVACSEPNQQCDSSCLCSVMVKERINYKNYPPTALSSCFPHFNIFCHPWRCYWPMLS